MNIKALRAFRHTLSEGTLAGAARAMNLSEPAISRLVSSLEGELRLDLFSRKGRRLTPTPYALAFYREAGRILDNLDEIPRLAAEIRAGRTTSLRVVTMPRVAPALVSPAVGSFLKRFPTARIRLDVRARREAGKWLAGREYDIGIGALPVDNPNIRTRPLLSARAMAILPREHALASRDEIRAEDLINEPLIGLMQGLLMRDQLDDFFRSAGLTPSYVCEVAALQLAVHLAADGAGLTVADALTVSVLETKQVVLRPIAPERWMAFGLLLPRNTELSTEGTAFVDALQERARVLAEAAPDNLST